jgi:hypothetical protein
MITQRLAHRTRLLACAVVVGLLTLLAVPVSAIEQGGLGGKPAYPKEDNPRSQSIFVHTLDAGTEARDGVQVINNTAETKNVLVYAVDSQISSGGAFACAQAADTPISVGTWAKLDKKELTLSPGTKETVEFTVKVPEDATPGEHNGCIVIQDTKKQAASDSNGIVLSLRSAIRLAVTVPGDIQKGLVFTGIGVQTKDERKLLLGTALKNSGNVSLDAKLDIKLLYPIGMTAASVGGSFPVLSGNEGRFNFEADRPFWGGWYRLAATAHYNDNPSNAIGEGNANAAISKDAWIFIAPQPVAAAIEGALLVLLVAGGGWLLKRRLIHKQALRSATKHKVEAHEDLHTIADQYGMSWKLLARLNNLKPPYQLRAGQTLNVTSQQKSPKRKKRA